MDACGQRSNSSTALSGNPRVERANGRGPRARRPRRVRGYRRMATHERPDPRASRRRSLPPCHSPAGAACGARASSRVATDTPSAKQPSVSTSVSKRLSGWGRSRPSSRPACSPIRTPSTWRGHNRGCSSRSRSRHSSTRGAWYTVSGADNEATTASVTSAHCCSMSQASVHTVSAPARGGKQPGLADEQTTDGIAGLYPATLLW